MSAYCSAGGRGLLKSLLRTSSPLGLGEQTCLNAHVPILVCIVSMLHDPSSRPMHGTPPEASTSGARSYAVSVEVTGTVDAALAQLRRKCQESDLQKEIRKVRRRHA